MNAFKIIVSLVLFALAFVCFIIPFKKGKPKTGYIAGGILGIIITLSLTINSGIAIVFLLPVFVFQVIFITYWSFYAFNKKKTGRVVATIIGIGFLLLLLQPWIADWTFNKADAATILSAHNIVLKDDFKILNNKAGGLTDYYETFTLKLSPNDFNRITELIKTSNNFKGYFINYYNPPAVDFKNTDTVDFETPHHFEREVYWKNKTMENGTYHFRFQLDKRTQELNYIGSDE